MCLISVTNFVLVTQVLFYYLFFGNKDVI